MKRKNIDKKIERLHDTVLQLSRAKTREEVYNITIDAAERILDYIICSFDIAEGNTLHTVAKSSQIPDDHVRDFDVSEGVIGKTFREKRTIVCGELGCDPDARPVKAELFKSAISAPIGEIGVFQAVSEFKDAFSSSDIRLLEILLGHVAEALNRIDMMSELERLASTDHLTGVLNRNMMYDIIARELENAKRLDLCLALVMIDMNGLKAINDNRGHLGGDLAISKCAALISETKRLSDILFRYGGDEFLLVMNLEQPNIDIFLERLRFVFDEFNGKRELPFKLGVSIGYAFWLPNEPVSIEFLIAKADDILYREKAQSTRGR